MIFLVKKIDHKYELINYNSAGTPADFPGALMAFDELHEDLSEHEETFKLDVKKFSSAALARLVDEVRNDEVTTSMAYDRAHNRHNR